jgi:hypothetical protein
MKKHILTVVAVLTLTLAGTAQAEGSFFDALKGVFAGGEQPATAGKQEAPAPATQTPATPATLTPEQLKVKATLEQVVTCQKKLKFSLLTKLIESLPGTKVLEKDGNISKKYSLETPLEVWGEKAYFVIFSNVDEYSGLDNSDVFLAAKNKKAAEAFLKNHKFKYEVFDGVEASWVLNTKQGYLTSSGYCGAGCDYGISGHFPVTCTN